MCFRYYFRYICLTIVENFRTLRQADLQLCRIKRQCFSPVLAWHFVLVSYKSLKYRKFCRHCLQAHCFHGTYIFMKLRKIVFFVLNLYLNIYKTSGPLLKLSTKSLFLIITVVGVITDMEFYILIEYHKLYELWLPSEQ